LQSFSSRLQARQTGEHVTKDLLNRSMQGPNLAAYMPAIEDVIVSIRAIGCLLG
jgi:hypothetical protein